VTVERRPLERSPLPLGIHIRHDILEEFNITQEQLADALGVSRLTVNQLCNDKRAVTAEMALRLERVTGIPAEHWMELQTRQDLWWARQNSERNIELLKPLQSNIRSRSETRKAK
jgi:addiction module HigA family antidote